MTDRGSLTAPGLGLPITGPLPVAAGLRPVAPAPPSIPEGDDPAVDLAAAERLTAEVDAALARVPDGWDRDQLRGWLGQVESLLPSTGPDGRARLLQARAAVRGGVPHPEGLVAAGSAPDLAGALQDTGAAVALFERQQDPLPAAATHAIAALAAVRCGLAGVALESTVRALVSFDAATAVPDAGRDPVQEALVAGLLGRVCQAFGDLPRALRFAELALAGAQGPIGSRHRSAASRDLVQVLLAQAQESDDDPEDLVRRGVLDRAEYLARGLMEHDGPPIIRRVDGPRLLAAVLCEGGRPTPALPLAEAARRALARIDPGRHDRDRQGAVHLVLGHCRVRLGQPEAAVRDLDAAVDLCGAVSSPADHASALRLRSAARQERGDLLGALADARALARRAVARRPQQASAFVDQVWARAGVEGRQRDLEARTRVLARTAESDPLTGLANRRAVQRFCQRLRSAGVCLVLVDVDHFKTVNDRFGHATGDVVLREIALLLSRSVRSVDVVARWGGEEFLVALPGGSGTLGAEAAARICGRVRDHPWAQVVPGLTLTVSAGVACGPGDQLEEVLGRADAAMYRAKQAGRDRVAAG